MKGFGDREFVDYSRLIHRRFGIIIKPEKMAVLATKVEKAMLKHGLTSYDEHLRLMSGPNTDYLWSLVEEITVHKTEFFREEGHFDYLRDHILGLAKQHGGALPRREIRMWSAGCSTGEEPYSLGMTLHRYVPDGTVIRILATDVSRKVLAEAQRGVYPLSAREGIPSEFRQSFIENGGNIEIAPVIRNLITFRMFNLMDSFPFKGQFDAIFCRNVMIYFTAEVQQTLIEKFYASLYPGGHLFIGHSESLSQKKHAFKYVQPTVYRK